MKAWINAESSPLFAAEYNDLRGGTKVGVVDSRENSVGCPPGVEIDTLLAVASAWQFVTSDESLVVLIIVRSLSKIDGLVVAL